MFLIARRLSTAMTLAEATSSPMLIVVNKLVLESFNFYSFFTDWLANGGEATIRIAT